MPLAWAGARSGGWGEGTVSDDVPDRLDHRFSLLQRVTTAEAEHSPALGFQVPGARGIVFRGVLRTIQFDH